MRLTFEVGRFSLDLSWGDEPDDDDEPDGIGSGTGIHLELAQEIGDGTYRLDPGEGSWERFGFQP